jgi:hypothetical protein
MTVQAVKNFTLNIDNDMNYQYFDESGDQISKIVITKENTEVNVTLTADTQSRYKVKCYNLNPISAEEQVSSHTITANKVSLVDLNTIKGKADLTVVAQSIKNPNVLVYCDPQVHNDPTE